MKPGYKTTEFWLTVAANLSFILGTQAGLPPQYAAIASAVSTGLYAMSRGTAKQV